MFKFHRLQRVSQNRKKRIAAQLLVTVSAVMLPALLVVGCSRQPQQHITPAPSPTPQPTSTVIRPTIPARLPEQGGLAPYIELVAVGGGNEPANVQNPGFLGVEMTGRQVSNVSLLGGVLEDGRQRVLFHEPVDPVPNDEIWPGSWADGVHDIVQTWDFTGDYLWDGQNGDFVVLWTTDPGLDTRTVHGRFRAAGDESYRDSVMVVNTESGLVAGIIDTSNGEALPLVAGDEFQVTELFLDADGEMHSEPGQSLSFEEGGHVAYTKRPVPSGTYFLQINAETTSGNMDTASVEYEVDNATLLAGYKAYLQPQLGFQLLYPEAWSFPSQQDGRILFQDPDGAIWMSISTHPNMSDQPILDLKQQALEAYGDVSLLYEDQIRVGQSGGLRTVYGYESAAGPRTGILLTFSQDNQPFLVDIDGPASQESELLEMAGVVADTWAIRELARSEDGHWIDVNIDGVYIPVPADHRSQQMSNGWIRLGGENEQTFLALRSEPRAGVGLLEGTERWLGVASGNVYDFSASEIYSFERGVQGWTRVDFGYSLDSGEQVAGTIMVTRIGDRLLIFWVESPADSFDQYEDEVVQTIVDDLSRNRVNGP